MGNKQANVQTRRELDRVVVSPRALLEIAEYLKRPEFNLEVKQLVFESEAQEEISSLQDEGVAIDDDGFAQYSEDCVDTLGGPMDEPYSIIDVVQDDLDGRPLEVSGRAYYPECDGTYLMRDDDVLVGPFGDDSQNLEEITPIRLKTKPTKRHLRPVR